MNKLGYKNYKKNEFLNFSVKIFKIKNKIKKKNGKRERRKSGGA